MVNKIANLPHSILSGCVRLSLIAVLGATVAACGGGKTPPAPAAATAKAAPAAPANPAAVASPVAASPAAAAPAAEPAPEQTVEQLNKEAATAFREQRYVAPAGSNAVELYLHVLDKDANNQIAKSALREIFPFATGNVEQEINTGNLDNATREIDLLAKVDPSNYTLTILRGKLDAKKKLADNEQKQKDAAAAAAAARVAAGQAAAAAAAQAAAQTAAAPPPPPPKPVAPKPAPAPTAAATPPPAPVGETHAAELIKTAPPDYPPEAYRAHQQGWVEVAFTVDAEGRVTDAKVTGSEPTRVFNSAALSAVRRWTFKPRMENGKAVPEQVTRRIQFKLGG